MTVTAVPSGHFQGGRALTTPPTTGADVRSLEDIENEIITDLNAATAGLADITAPFDWIGNIAAAADFPLIADVEKGWFYVVTTGCTDNAGATHTNTGDVFLTGDKIAWNGTGWTLLERGVSTATPAAIGVAAAGTSPIKSNQDHVHAHGNQVGGTLHAAAVAGVSDGFMTAAMATTLAAVTDDHIRAAVTGLDMKTDEHEHSAALNGDAGKKFYATHLLVKSSLNVGALNADGTINVGTAADGSQIASGVALTGVTSAGTGRMIPLPAHSVLVNGNATLYVNVESAETGAGTLEIDVVVCGRQF